MNPITTADSNMAKHPFDGIIVHLNSAILKEFQESNFVVQYVIDSPMNKLALFMTCQPYQFKKL